MSDTDLNHRLRNAVAKGTVPPYLAARVRAHVRERPSRAPWLQVILGAAAACAFGAILIGYHLGHFRYTPAAQESYIATVSDHVATLLSVGLGQHIRCSVFHDYPKNAPPLEAVEQGLAPEYRGLVAIVQHYVPDEYHLVMAHRCHDQERQFVHLTFSNGSNLISILVTPKIEGKSFDPSDLLASFAPSGTRVYCAGSQRFQVSAFASPRFLVYFVSDLPKPSNSAMMLAMAPGIQDFLKNLGS